MVRKTLKKLVLKDLLLDPNGRPSLIIQKMVRSRFSPICHLPYDYEVSFNVEASSTFTTVGLILFQLKKVIISSLFIYSTNTAFI